MAKVQISARMDDVLKNALKRYRKSQGIVMNQFNQEALIGRLEELEDIEDVKQLRHEPTRRLREVLAEVGLHDRT